MSLPARITDFQPLTTIQSGVVDSEFDSLINLLNGTDQTRSIRVRSNDGSFAVARFDQLAASANIAEFFRGGVSVARFDNSGNLLIEKDSPFIVMQDNTGQVGTNFAMNYNGGVTVIGRQGQSDLSLDNATGIFTFGQQPVLPSKFIRWAVTWVYTDLSTRGTDANFDLIPGVWIPGDGWVCTHFSVQANSGTASGSVTFELRKKAFNTLSQVTLSPSITLNPGSVGGGTESAITLNGALSVKEHLYPVITANSSALKGVWVSARGYRPLEVAS